MNTEQARFNMIEQQIRPWDVLDPAVLALLSQVQRENFVPEAHRALAFMDTEVPLPDGQCMLAPRVEARLLQELQLQGGENVLEVGAGSGFMAALLAHRARQVLTLEISETLARLAQHNLQRARIANVTVRHYDGSLGARGEAPFDAIVLSGSVAEVPQPLLEQLKRGGRLIAIVGGEPVMRARLYKRIDDASWSQDDLFDTVAPRLRNFPQPERFSF
ncbi:MAG TPA: protein-L-isoaspartate O-methyltransferase [Rubrivivax sp.]|nr:protein-L-isoaspartate O-methyltransferase [Rubrivivax sp.]HPO20315.1 protein-L-isoaspartate O-methyltransferase [Rubrivivax sp.]